MNINNKLEILLVEDEILTAMVMKLDLEKGGYLVAQSVVSGEDAVSAINEIKIDVILMDIRLAGDIDGIEAAAQIQNIKEIPVIFMTGYDDAEIRAKAEALEPLAYLLKPLDMAALIKILEKF